MTKGKKKDEDFVPFSDEEEEKPKKKEKKEKAADED